MCNTRVLLFSLSYAAGSQAAELNDLEKRNKLHLEKSKMFQFRHCLLPLFAMDLADGIPQDPKKSRYIGVSFHFNDMGNIATCSHIVQSLQANESLVGVEMYGECLCYKVEDIRCHKKYDFAVGRVGRTNYRPVAIHGKKDIYIGANLMAYGFTSNQVQNSKEEIHPRLFKGHVVRTHHEPILPVSKSTCEISFPSLKGFSGAPLLFDKEEASVAGMLFSNFESSITLHQLTEIDDKGNKFAEVAHRVVELGVAHTAFDIRCYLNDLGIDRVALDTPNPDSAP